MKRKIYTKNLTHALIGMGFLNILLLAVIESPKWLQIIFAIMYFVVVLLYSIAIETDFLELVKRIEELEKKNK